MITAPVLCVHASDRDNNLVVRAKLRETCGQVDLQLNGRCSAIDIADAELLIGMRSALILQFCAVSIQQFDADSVLVPFVPAVALNFAVEVDAVCALQESALDLRQGQPEVHLVQLMRRNCVVLSTAFLYDRPLTVLVDLLVTAVLLLGDVPVSDHLLVCFVLVIFDQIVAFDEIGEASRRREHDLSERL